MPSKSNRVSRKSSGIKMSMPKLSKKSCKVLTLVLSVILVLIGLYLLNKYVLKINVRENFQDINNTNNTGVWLSKKQYNIIMSSITDINEIRNIVSEAAEDEDPLKSESEEYPFQYSGTAPVTTKVPVPTTAADLTTFLPTATVPPLATTSTSTTATLFFEDIVNQKNGPQGPQGEQGPAGEQGAKGDKGDIGPAGQNLQAEFNELEESVKTHDHLPQDNILPQDNMTFPIRRM
jgi:hypothetical protein